MEEAFCIPCLFLLNESLTKLFNIAEPGEKAFNALTSATLTHLLKPFYYGKAYETTGRAYRISDKLFPAHAHNLMISEHATVNINPVSAPVFNNNNLRIILDSKSEKFRNIEDRQKIRHLYKRVD